MTTDEERDLIIQRALADGPPETVQPPDRLSVHPQKRILMACTAAGMLGAALGVSHGANVTGLKFRAENAHRLPTSQQGWFLYHKSKNYAVMLGGVKEAARMSARLAVWTSLFLIIEEIVDRSRQSRDALSTLCAGLTTAGAFSLYSKRSTTYCGNRLQLTIPRSTSIVHCGKNDKLWHHCGLDLWSCSRWAGSLTRQASRLCRAVPQNFPIFARRNVNTTIPSVVRSSVESHCKRQ